MAPPAPLVDPTQPWHITAGALPIAGTAPDAARPALCVRVLHLDGAVVVIDKPSGLLAVPGRTPAHADCVVAQVQRCWAADAREVHRLDMATSGLMVLARGAAAHRQLSMAFAARQIRKRYSALVAGDVASATGAAEGWIDLPLMCDWPNRPRQKLDLLHGKASLTRWRVLPPWPSTEDLPESKAAGAPDGLSSTRLELEPLTGRTHQLRVHCLALGHPILGDALYAPPAVQQAAPRLCLHASELGFTHPTDGRWLMFQSVAAFFQD